MKVIYLHGFASSGNSSKSNWLREQFSSDLFSELQYIEFISPDLPDKPLEAIAFLDHYLTTLANESVCLIGTSLGGFFAAYYAGKHNWPAVLINPLSNVQDLTHSAMGENVNFSTGKAFILDQCDADCLVRISNKMSTPQQKSLLLLDKGDDLLDYQKSVARYSNDAFTHLFEGGSHRFDHLPESMPYIISLLRKALIKA